MHHGRAVNLRVKFTADSVHMFVVDTRCAQVGSLPLPGMLQTQIISLFYVCTKKVNISADYDLKRAYCARVWNRRKINHSTHMYRIRTSLYTVRLELLS